MTGGFDMRVEARENLGLYLHIPFCVQKCAYCDFLSMPSDEVTKKQYVRALIAEIYSYKEMAKEYLVKTIFIGGGTPSCLEEADIYDIMAAVKKTFVIEGMLESEFEKQPEISIEVNPGTLTYEKLVTYKKAGINRLSMGLQSADNEELKLLGRIHSYEEFEANYRMARQVGYTNINIDLMSALPGQTVASWKKTLDKIIGLQPEHISAYSLIVEEGTPFYERYGSEGARFMHLLPSEEEDRAIYQLTKEILFDAGYRRYEISNYAKPGYESKHNSSYWTGAYYLGLGLGASSLLHNERFHNEEELEEYLRLSKNHKDIRRDLETLDQKQRIEEFMFLGLRRMEGIHESVFEDKFQVSLNSIYENVLNQLEKDKLIVQDQDTIALTDKGVDLSNYVLAQFLLDE